MSAIVEALIAEMIGTGEKPAVDAYHRCPLADMPLDRLGLGDPLGLAWHEDSPLMVKGAAARVFVNQQANALSDIAVDCRRANAVSVEVLVTGTTPSATISLEGSSEEGGNYLPLPDPNASQSAVGANKLFDAVVGKGWVKVRVASISGTFGAGQGYTIIVTPYVSPGQAVLLDAAGNPQVDVVGAALTALQLIDDMISGSEAQVDVVAALPAGTNTIGATRDAGPSWTSVFGVSGARFTSADASASAAAVTDAPTAGQKLVITDVLISVDTAMRVDLKEETSGTIIASLYLPANGSAQWTARSKTKLATADKKLQVQTSAAGNIAVTAHYYSEA